MKNPIQTSHFLAAAAVAGTFLMPHRADAQITVKSERVATGMSTNGTFVFPTVPSNTSEDLANGKTFTVLAGAANASGPIANLTNGLAQTNQDSVPQSFFADGTSNLRVQLDLGSSLALAAINSYSWHANARAPQIYRVYGAVAPSNNAPGFAAAAFQDDAALEALGYKLIATVSTPLDSGGQVGVSISSPEASVGTYRFLLFDMAPPVFGVGPRPTFYGEIDIIAAAKPTRFPITITPATAPATGYNLAWESRPAMVYHLRTSTDLGTAIADWQPVAENIPATPPENTYNVLHAGPRRFYAVEESPAPPLLSQNFENGNGGFTVVTTQGSAWAHGSPTSSGPGGIVNAGNGGSANCWGTNIGNPGYYTQPTVTALRSPVIDLRNVAGASLVFAQALDLEEGNTAVVNVINATTDAVIAAAVYTAQDTAPTAAGWAAAPPINLAAGVGQQVRIEWSFSGLAGTDYMGWYIDNVVVTETAP